MPAPPENLRSIEALLAIMRALRDPATGCPWDREQSFETIAPYTIEEAYEVADAIDRGDTAALEGELGDLLFQTVYHAQIAAEAGAFTFADVVEAIAEKLVRRHPHVFGSAGIRSARDQNTAWEAMKAGERRAQGQAGALDDVPLALPALLRATKLQNRAAREGFQWRNTGRIVEKLREELGELAREIEAGAREKAEAEFGDVLFVLVNLARQIDIDAEDALRQTNAKFEARFRYVEARCRAAGRELRDVPLGELEALWLEAKSAAG
jgi:tetrapyrrole methylase family protein/MazG family protein/ATP diphosphatase